MQALLKYGRLHLCNSLENSARGKNPVIFVKRFNIVVYDDSKSSRYRFIE